MSNIAPQHEGLNTSPCPVPRSAINPSIVSSTSVSHSWFLVRILIPFALCLSHTLTACGVLTTDVPFSSSPTNHCTHDAGTPSRDHANRIMFLDTLSNALVMSHELTCKGSSFSTASSMAFINISEAVIVFRPAVKPC